MYLYFGIPQHMARIFNWIAVLGCIKSYFVSKWIKNEKTYNFALSKFDLNYQNKHKGNYIINFALWKYLLKDVTQSEVKKRTQLCKDWGWKMCVFQYKEIKIEAIFCLSEFAFNLPVCWHFWKKFSIKNTMVYREPLVEGVSNFKCMQMWGRFQAIFMNKLKKRKTMFKKCVIWKNTSM